MDKEKYEFDLNPEEEAGPLEEDGEEASAELELDEEAFRVASNPMEEFEAFKAPDQRIIESLFPTDKPGVRTSQRLDNDRFQMLQYMTTLREDTLPWTVLGVFRRKFDSHVLALFQEEHSRNEIARDGQGSKNLVEVVVSMKEDVVEEKK